MANPHAAYRYLLRDLPNTVWPSPDVPPGDHEGALWSTAQNPSCPPQIKREAERILAEFAAERKTMPHPNFTLPRDLAAALSRCAASAHYLPTWYSTNNAPQAVAALKQAASQALRAKGDEALTPSEREQVGALLADLDALR